MYYGDAGLGFTATAAVGDTAGSFIGMPFAGNVLDTISKYLRIGAGRNEADQITPTQNEFAAYMTQVGQYVNATNDLSALQTLANNFARAWSSFLEFVNNRVQFPDGRASAQAIHTLNGPPNYLVTGIQNGIAARMAELGGTLQPMNPTQDAGVANLAYPVYGESNVPQAGRLPYYPPTTRPGILAAGSNVLPIAAVGIAALFLFGRRSR